MDTKEILKFIPKWLIMVLIFVFLIVFLERLYIAKEPFFLFGKAFGPATKLFQEDKKEIYNYFIKELKKRENAVERLRNENLVFRNQLITFESDILSMRPLFGKIISSNNTSLANVKIEVEGGSQIFSNSNGEFVINCPIGQLIIIEKDGYKSYSFIVNEEHFAQYQKIILARGES